MQTFIDQATGACWKFEDDVQVSKANGSYAFKSRWGVLLRTPTTLQPGVAPPPAPAPSPAQIIATLTAAVQAHLDATARTRNYDGILSLCSYAASTHPKFGPEGLAGVAWRDAVWASCYSIMADVQAGTRSVPTADELLTELPSMEWPA